MPEKILNCAGCKTFLGTIENGKLRKDIIFLCGNCDNKRLGALMKMETSRGEPKDKYGLGGEFDDIFGGIFGKK